METYLIHYGIPRRSGRYPYGSGDDPYQSEKKKYRRGIERIAGLDAKASKYDRKATKYLRKSKKQTYKARNADDYDEDSWTTFFGLDKESRTDKALKYDYKGAKYADKAEKKRQKAQKIANKLMDEYGDLQLSDVPPSVIALGKKYYMDILVQQKGGANG